MELLEETDKETLPFENLHELAEMTKGAEIMKSLNSLENRTSNGKLPMKPDAHCFFQPSPLGKPLPEG